MKYLKIVLLTQVYLAGGWLSKIETSPPEPYHFAEHFFMEEDYYRAATEYQRAYFPLPPGQLRDMGILRAAESFYKGEQPKHCLSSLATLSPTTHLATRRLILEKFCLAQRNLLQAASSLQDWPEPFAAHQAAVWRAMYYGKLPEDSSLFLKTYEYPLPEGLLYPLAGPEFVGIVAKAKPQQKSPALASLLSAVFPGAGQWYYGSFGDGLTSFSAVTFLGLIGALAWKNNETTLAALTLTGSGIFYTAGIYGAWRGAERFNEQSTQILKRQVAQLSLRYDVYRFH